MKQTKVPERLIRPWADTWQVWEREGSEWIASGTFPNLEDVAMTAVDYLVLPARKVACLPLWIDSGDEAVIKDSAVLQLEVSGCLPVGAPADSVSVSKVHGGEDRSLVRAAVFPTDYVLPSGLEPGRFLASPLALDLPGNALCIWRELDGLVLALTTPDAVVVCWEFLSPPANPEGARLAVERFLLEMQGDDVIRSSPRVVDWSGVLGGVMVAGQFADSRDDSQGPRPVVPASVPAWAPPAVLSARAGRARKLVLKRVAMGVGAVLIIAAATVSGLVIWSSQRNVALEAEVAQLSVQADPLIRTAREWQLLGPSVDPDEYALERLLLAVESLPAEGVRLSLFEMTPAGLRIEGDAKNVGLATLYFNTLRTAEGGERFEWTMAPPTFQPDNSAKFAIEGVPAI